MGKAPDLDYISASLRPLAQPLHNLHPDQRNARRHDERNIDAIADSLRQFGQQKPIVVQKNGKGFNVLAGNGTLRAALKLGWTHLAAAEFDRDDTGAAVAFGIADNRTAELAEWDGEMVAGLLEDLAGEYSPADLGFTDDELDGLLADEPSEVVEDEVPEPPADPVTKPGDLWTLGDHRLLCGDSTNADDVARLMDGATAVLLHADPPYGMGKESEGVQNDNLYREKLDRFQMDWWRTFRPHLADNASAYIWGNAPDLWRLWYVGGLADSERLTFRSQVIWDKPPSASAWGSPIGSDKMRSYPHGYEVCHLFMLGEQGFNNNADNYWEGWEPIRAELAASCDAMGWGAKDVEQITGVGMFGHWFTRSQWTFIPEEHYRKLRDAARGDVFKREHDELKREHDELKREHDELKQAFYATRAYFDNTHDNMTDVWDFPRVTGEERHGHVTPKPVAMIARALLSSSPPASLVLEPFLGSGTTLIAAEQTGRRCYGMEISPAYCDVIVERWQNLTGGKATRG